MSSNQTDQTDPANPFAPPDSSTSARNLLTVALRVFAFWLVCKSVIDLPQIGVYLLYVFQSPNPLGTGTDPVFVVLMMILQLGAPLVVGIGVILLAGRISRRFYPPSAPAADPIVFGRVGAGDLYYVASFMMGIYILIQAVAPAVSVLAGSMGGEPLSIEPWSDSGVHGIITVAIYSVSGLFLIFGARGIAQAMTAVPRDSDEVPLPQFSIRILLILGVAFAIVLGVLRAVIVGIR